jgi:hypothetical protein
MFSTVSLGVNPVSLATAGRLLSRPFSPRGVGHGSAERPHPGATYPRLRPSGSKLLGRGLAKRPAPLTARGIRHEDATGAEERFDVTGAQAKAAIAPDARADDLGRETIVLVMVR